MADAELCLFDEPLHLDLRSVRTSIVYAGAAVSRASHARWQWLAIERVISGIDGGVGGGVLQKYHTFARRIKPWVGKANRLNVFVHEAGVFAGTA